MARKLPRLQRVLGAPALFSVAYGEIGSSIYFALGIIALHALGLTPVVLLAAGLLFLLVTLSYAEGTSSIRETGGAATFVRIAFNDLIGFVTGWAIFLDYLIVIALSSLFLPNYVSRAFGIESLRESPWNVVMAITAIWAIALVRLVRRSRLYMFVIVVAVLDLFTQLLLVVLGFALVFSTDAVTRGTDLGTSPTWYGIAFALPLAMLAFTGLETIANFAEETRRPGIDIPRAIFGAVGLVVALYVLIALVGLSAFPPENGTTLLGTEWLRAPLMGIVDALSGHLPGWLGGPLRVYVGVTAALILIAAATTSISGFTRLAYSLGEHGQLPRTYGRLHRRTLASPAALASAAAIATVLVLVTARLDEPVAFLASLFSFGILLAFTAAQLAVIKLRFSQPARTRPFKVPLGVRFRGTEVPLPSIVGAVLTFAIWIVALATHEGARYAGPAWLVAGFIVYTATRVSHGEGLTEHVVATSEQDLPPEATFSSILVPLKLSDIGEEMVATAVKLAQDSQAKVHALHVVRVPLDRPLGEASAEEEEQAVAAIAEAKLLGSDYGVEVEGHTIEARSIGEAIVAEAGRLGVDLVMLGSAPRWRRQSRFFSPTVEYVLRKAPCEVLIVAFPQGVFEEEPVPA
ncbi:MAG: universal stress protein [Actinomycetota bacterium]|nr:universal stress protein [Actinomycetota bacterium]